MGKVFLTTIPSDVGMRALIADGKMLKFNFNGRCISEQPVDYNIGTLQEVDIVSLLVTGNRLEIGYHIDHIFSKETSNKNLSDIIPKLNNANGLVFVGINEGNVDGLGYQQYIYSFIKGYFDKGTLAN